MVESRRHKSRETHDRLWWLVPVIRYAQPIWVLNAGMRVVVRVAGGETRELEVTDETYADLVERVGLSVQEAAVLVDGRPVPEDQRVTAEEVDVIRLVSGG